VTNAYTTKYIKTIARLLMKNAIITVCFFIFLPFIVQAEESALSKIDLLDFLKNPVSLNMDSVGDFINALNPETQGGAVLVLDSITDQGGSLSHPRLLRYDERSGIFIAVGSDPSKKAYNTVEIIDMGNKSGETSRMGVINFSYKPPTITWHGGKCTSCHGDRVIWDPAPVNPYFLGLREGSLTQISTGDEKKLIDSIRHTWKDNDRFKGIEWSSEKFRSNTQRFSQAIYRNNFLYGIREISQLTKGKETLLFISRLLKEKSLSLSSVDILKLMKEFGLVITKDQFMAAIEKQKQDLKQHSVTADAQLAPYLKNYPKDETAQPNWELSEIQRLTAIDLMLKQQGHPGLRTWSTTFRRPSLGFSGSMNNGQEFLEAIEYATSCTHLTERLGNTKRNKN
jgi:hypothetical protein